MPNRVVSINISTSVWATIHFPSWINLNPEREGFDWYIRWNILHYKDNDGVWKEYEMAIVWDGNYKHPEIDEMEEEPTVETDMEE